MDELKPLSNEELAALDAAYAPFPTFGEWGLDVPRAGLWERRLKELKTLAGQIDEQQLDAATQIAVRAAAFDTGAIEGLYSTDRGLTMTVAQQAYAWEQRVAEHGNDAVALFKAQLATYELVLDVAAQRLPVTEAWIRTLHEALTAPQETYVVHTPVDVREVPLPRGQYKHHPNHVRLQDGSRHAYAPVDRTPDEMNRLVGELSNEGFASAHALLQAAYAHYVLVCVHPFADGNGRVARALASVYLYRAGRVPLLVFADQRDRYFDALEAADGGEPQDFTAFVSDAGIGAAELVLESIKAAESPSTEDALAFLKEVVTGHGGLAHDELDALGHGLLEQFQHVFAEELRNVDVPAGVSVTPTIYSPGGSPPSSPEPAEKFRPILSRPHVLRIALSSSAPATANRQAEFRVFVSNDRDPDSDTFWLKQEGSETGTTFSLADVRPKLSSFAENRLRLFAGRVIAEELNGLALEAKESLRQGGYTP